MKFTTRRLTRTSAVRSGRASESHRASASGKAQLRITPVTRRGLRKRLCRGEFRKRSVLRLRFVRLHAQQFSSRVAIIAGKTHPPTQNVDDPGQAELSAKVNAEIVNDPNAGVLS